MHVPKLKQLADQVHHVTEFGVRTGVSSRAFLNSNATQFRMYDLILDPQLQSLVHMCAQSGKDVIYQAANTLTCTIEPTDLLFIDTLHTHDQVWAELNRHAHAVRRYLVFHDTHTFGLQDEPGFSGPGLLPAILKFMAETRAWQVVYHTPENNGLTVLERHHVQSGYPQA